MEIILIGKEEVINNPNIPNGTIYAAFSIKGNINTIELHLDKSRTENLDNACDAILKAFYDYLYDISKDYYNGTISAVKDENVDDMSLIDVISIDKYNILMNGTYKEMYNEFVRVLELNFKDIHNITDYLDKYVIITTNGLYINYKNANNERKFSDIIPKINSGFCVLFVIASYTFCYFAIRPEEKIYYLYSCVPVFIFLIFYFAYRSNLINQQDIRHRNLYGKIQSTYRKRKNNPRQQNRLYRRRKYRRIMGYHTGAFGEEPMHSWNIVPT